VNTSERIREWLFETSGQTCLACGRRTSDPRAVVWDGALWRLMQYLDPRMKWGPYCQVCALRTAGVLDANHVQPEEAPAALEAKP
jgi:hypothetical protein